MELFLQAFVTLFVIIDPVGNAPIFAVMTRGMSDKAIRKIARKASVITLCLLLLFGLIGSSLLTMLGISISAFRIAGGLLLFVIAFRMLMGYHDPDQLDSEKSVYGDRSDMAVFPFAIPLLAGPGGMTASILLMTSNPGLIDKSIVTGVLVLVVGIAYFSMAWAARINAKLGHSGGNLLARIVGILLAALSVQYVADGIEGLLTKIIA